MKCFILCAADDGRRIAYFATRRWVRRTLAALEREEALHIYHTNSGEGSTRCILPWMNGRSRSLRRNVPNADLKRKR